MLSDGVDESKGFRLISRRELIESIQKPRKRMDKTPIKREIRTLTRLLSRFVETCPKLKGQFRSHDRELVSTTLKILKAMNTWEVRRPHSWQAPQKTHPRRIR